MCLAIPGQVKAFVDETGHIARVDVGGVKRKVNVGLVVDDGLEVGDWVLIHVGFAIQKVDEEEAAETYAFLEDLGEEFEQEMEELKGSDIA